MSQTEQGLRMKRRSPKQQQRLVQTWNQEVPVGAAVAVTEDNGTVSHTKTNSEAFLLGGHSAVVFLADRGACFSLERCKTE